MTFIAACSVAQRVAELGAVCPTLLSKAKGATYPIPQTNLHCSFSLVTRHMSLVTAFETGGCSAPQAARADGRAPLLIQSLS